MSPPKQKTINETIPKMYLEERKIVFNKKAIEELHIGGRVNITFEETSDGTTPALEFGESITGNKVTQKGTVIYAGKQNQALSEFGNEFDLILSGEGKYLLKGNKQSTTLKTCKDVPELPEQQILDDIAAIDTEEINQTELTTEQLISLFN